MDRLGIDNLVRVTGEQVNAIALETVERIDPAAPGELSDALRIGVSVFQARAADSCTGRSPTISATMPSRAWPFCPANRKAHLLRGTMRPDVPIDLDDDRENVQRALLRHGDLVLNRSRRGLSKPIIQYRPVRLSPDAPYL